jgi:hypothetical protein
MHTWHIVTINKFLLPGFWDALSADFSIKIWCAFLIHLMNVKFLNYFHIFEIDRVVRNYWFCACLKFSHTTVGANLFWVVCSRCPDWLWGPPSLLFGGWWGQLLLVVKWPGHEVNYSPTSSARVKNEWSYTSALPVCLLGVNRENYVFVPFLTQVSSTILIVLLVVLSVQ